MLRRKFLSMLANLPLLAIPVAAATAAPREFFDLAPVRPEGVAVGYDPGVDKGNYFTVYESDRSDTWGDATNTHLHELERRYTVLTEAEREDFPAKIQRDLIRRRINARRQLAGKPPLPLRKETDYGKGDVWF